MANMAFGESLRQSRPSFVILIEIENHFQLLWPKPVETVDTNFQAG